jgi:hypothetical protein
MLSVFKRWFGHDRGAGAATRRPGGEYQPELIAGLQAEHRELLGLFGELERASEQNDEGACRAALERFTRALQEHLLTENRHLYGYFARNPSVDPSVARRVDSMSGDMMRVGKILHRFITTYARTTWTSALHANLRTDLRAIGEVLSHRIHEEETVLYPLYAPRAP